ncbi:hypothetical protein ABZP36_023924 [Zizania latifolia]
MEVGKGTMTVVGRFDANKLRDRVAIKTKKKVDLLGNNDNTKKGGGGGGNNKEGNRGDGKPDKEDEDDKSKEQEEAGKQPAGHKVKGDKYAAAAAGGGGGGGKGKAGGNDNKKPLVPVVGTVVLKIGAVGLHCDGCMDRIRAKLFNIKGVEQVSMDMAKNQVTVTGTMDIKAMPEKLRKKLRRPVDVVPTNNKQQKQPQPQQDGKDGKEGKDSNDAVVKAPAAEKEAWNAAFYDQQALLDTEFMLSDENPNACSIT